MGAAITVDFFDSDSKPIEQYSSYADDDKELNIELLPFARSVRIKIMPDKVN